MTPEEQLDRLIEVHKRNGALRPVGDDELLARLDAADALAALRRVEVPDAFAARLEARVRQRARSLSQPDQRLTFVPRSASQDKARPFFRRAWVGGLVMAATLLLACIGAFTAAASSLPGDPLYGLKQVEQQVSLTLAGSAQSRAQVNISHLRSAVADLSDEVYAGRSDADVMQALSIVADETRESQAAVVAMSAGPDRDAAQQDLTGALTQEEQTLRQLLARVDWSLRVAFTGQLGALGDTVPTITQITVKQQSDNALVVTVTGTNFTAETQFVLNGQPRGTLLSQTATQMVVALSQDDWHGKRQSIGVQNADGTAAQGTFTGDEHGGDGHDGTPGAAGTPGDGEGDGKGHGGSGSGGSSGGSGSGGSSGGSDDGGH
jgi:uncharacterized membrane protein YgcG